MGMSVNTNVVSLNAQRNLGSSASALATSMQRLSSGLRVNSAKDDAAGLAISERMNTQVRGLNVASRNANDGISLAQTAEGALGKVGDMLQRMRELAVQSANATNSTTDRAALQAEVQQLKDEIGRVATTTKFNGTSLLNGTFTAQNFQVGANSGETITLAAIANANLAALGTLTPPPVTTYTQSLPAASATAFATGIASGALTINGIGIVTADGAADCACRACGLGGLVQHGKGRRRCHRTGQRHHVGRRCHHLDRRLTDDRRHLGQRQRPDRRHDCRYGDRDRSKRPRPASPT